VSGPPTIAVFGAWGLIGQSLGEDLRRRGFRVVAIARRFSPAQRAAFDPDAVEAPIVSLGAERLTSPRLRMPTIRLFLLTTGSRRTFSSSMCRTALARSSSSRQQ